MSYRGSGLGQAVGPNQVPNPTYGMVYTPPTLAQNFASNPLTTLLGLPAYAVMQIKPDAFSNCAGLGCSFQFLIFSAAAWGILGLALLFGGKDGR
jgi:hypothetical protein